MATTVPAPVLDLRNGDLVTAQSIDAFPAELSDRSASNPSVAITEAHGTFFDKLIFQLNSWASTGVIQKCLNLVGAKLQDAKAATVSQSFTLSSPQSSDSIIPKGTAVSTDDGSVSFATLEDLTVPAYTAPTGTAALASGSATVTGTGTTFVTGSTWEGWQIQIPSVTGTWYTIESVSTTTSLTLTTSAAATVATSAFFVGPVTGSVTAQATVPGASTNVGAGKLTTLSSSPANVESTTNLATATGGSDEQTPAEAIENAPLTFSSRDVACSGSDYEVFSVKALGDGGRTSARVGYNGDTATQGNVSLALLSPAWTTDSTVATSEQAAVIRDLVGRQFAGSTTLTFPAVIVPYTPTILVWRNANYDSATVKVNVAAAANSYLSPNTYPWQREIASTDLVQAVEAATGVDHIESINGISCLTVGATTTTANTVTFTNNSTTATGTAGDFTTMEKGRTVLIDSVNNAAYVVTNISAGTLTLDRAFTGPTASATIQWFNPGNTTTFGPTVTDGWKSLPYSSLSVDVDDPPATVFIVGSVTS